jgi:hypothetical protein
MKLKTHHHFQVFCPIVGLLKKKKKLQAIILVLHSFATTLFFITVEGIKNSFLIVKTRDSLDS